MGKVMTDLSIRIAAQVAELNKGVNQANTTLNNFQKQTQTLGNKLTSTFKGLGVGIAAAFTVDKIKDFIVEASKLAGQAEGVKQAFDNLNDRDLLNNLREATAGTVSDLDLMKAAVQARNFKIPLDQLATYFKFASKRAEETGESVDFLVESIIMGIGRQSPLILDNLGLSAKELSNRFKETGDFGKAAGDIIREELSNMGELMGTDAQKQAELTAETQNFKVALGQLANTLKGDLAPAATEGVRGLTQMLDLTNQIISDENISGWQKFAGLVSMSLGVNGMAGIANLQAGMAAADFEKNKTKYAIEDDIKGVQELAKTYENELLPIKEAEVKAAQEKIGYLEKEREFAQMAFGESESVDEVTTTITARINALNQYISGLNEEKEVNEEIQSGLVTIKDYQDAIKDIQNEITSALPEQLPNLYLKEDSLRRQLELLEEQAKIDAGLIRRAGSDDVPMKLEPIAFNGLDVKPISKELKEVNTELDRANSGWSNLTNTIEISSQEAYMFSSAIGQMGSALGRVLSDGESGWEAFGKSVLDVIMSIMTGLLAQAIMGLYANETSKEGVWGLAVASLASAGMYAIYDSIVGGIEFADGGIVYGETLATVGEYSGARTNPEVIAPLNKLQNILGSNNGVGEVVFKIEGTQLVGVLNKQNKISNIY